MKFFYKKNRYKNNIKNAENIVNSIVNSFVSNEAIIEYKLKKYWELMKIKSNDLLFTETKIETVINNSIFIKCNNSLVRNELFLKKSEIVSLINLYLVNNLGKKYIKKIVLK